MKNFEIKLDKENSKVKLYHQLYLSFAQAIGTKEIPEGTKLPSIRALSEKFDISRNTVTKAYNELQSNGYIFSLSKSGYFAKNPAEDAPGLLPEEKSDENEIPTVDSVVKERMKEMNKTVPILEEIDQNSAEKSETYIIQDPFSYDEKSAEEEIVPNSVQKAEKSETELLMNSGDLVKSSTQKEFIGSPIEAYVESAQNAILEHKHRLEEKLTPDPMGEAPLRIAIASFLYKFHHVDVNPSQIVVGVNNATILYKLLALDEFQKPGNSVRGLLKLAEKTMETKSISPSVSVISRQGSTAGKTFAMQNFAVNRIPVEFSGAYSAELEKNRSTVAYIHSKDLEDAEKRRDMLQWVQKEGYRFVIENDTSTEIGKKEFISAEEKDRCIYIIDFSNLISKSINLSVAVLPKKIIESYKNRYECLGSPLSMLTQITLTDFLIKDKLINYLSDIEQL